MQPNHSSRRILLPAKYWFVLLSLVCALGLNLIPLGRFSGMPDWVAVVLVFWCIHQPLRVGIATSFFFGLLMDVGNASVMGQHSLAYVVVAFVAGMLSRRILWFPLSQQAVHVFPMLLLTQLIMLAIRLIAGDSFPGFAWFLASVSGTLIWYPLTFLLLLPQYQPVERDENRPI